MGYYIRVLGVRKTYPSVPLLNEALEAAGVSARAVCDVGDQGSWDQIIVEHADGHAISMIERHPIEPNSLGAAKDSQTKTVFTSYGSSRIESAGIGRWQFWITGNGEHSRWIWEVKLSEPVSSKANCPRVRD